MKSVNIRCCYCIYAFESMLLVKIKTTESNIKLCKQILRNWTLHDSLTIFITFTRPRQRLFNCWFGTTHKWKPRKLTNMHIVFFIFISKKTLKKLTLGLRTAAFFPLVATSAAFFDVVREASLSIFSYLSKTLSRRDPPTSPLESILRSACGAAKRLLSWTVACWCCCCTTCWSTATLRARLWVVAGSGWHDAGRHNAEGFFRTPVAVRR